MRHYFQPNLSLVRLYSRIVPDDRRDGRVVAVVHPGEEVVLDLIVESAVHVHEPRSAHVGGCGNLGGHFLVIWQFV